MRSHLDRRGFLTSVAAGVATLQGGGWSGASRAESVSALQKLHIACIGTANRAAEDIQGVQSEDIVALCDVDRNYLARARGQFPRASHYEDYREMLDRERDRIDAVVIGTADHHHAPASLLAIRAGKHVYCEKPLTHTVQEARIVTRAAREHGVVTQLGTQIHADENYRRVVEIIQSGVLGAIGEVHVWVGKGWGGGQRPTPQDPPAHLNWDLWLGPAPVRPYGEGYHPANWRRWWDFGQGTLGDMGCHFMDLPFWALELRYPTHCVAEGPAVDPETCPLGLKVVYQFPARGRHPAVQLTWYDGDMIPRSLAGQSVPGNGVMFIGSEGAMFADYTRYSLFPKEKFGTYKPPAPSIPRSIGHHAEWIRGCKDGPPTTCHFDYSGPLTETVLLGNVAYRSQSPLEWDAESLSATNCPAASSFVAKEYRDGWKVATA